MTDQKTRSFEMTLDIDAPVEAVWKALADADEVMRWFATRATITPGEGGTYSTSWDGAWEWTCTIDRWEPNRRLRVVDRAQRPYAGDGTPMAHVAPAEIVLEFTLEGRGGGTLLRVVNAGFGHGAAWDDEIDGVSLGWNKELRGLRHYLEHHRGKDRQMAWVAAVTDAPMADVWQRLTGPGGYLEGEALSWLHGGDRARVRIAGAEELSGPVLYAVSERCLVLAPEQYGDGLFRVQVDRAAGKTMVHTALSTWGRPASGVDRFNARAKQALAETLAIEIA